LDDELGLEPTAATRALETAILRQADVHSLLPRPIARPQAFVAERSIRLLGRDRELDMLDQAARAALAGSFALVQIEGDAGLGKTRMLDEAVTIFADARVGRTQCSLLEQHLPYVPLAAALRDAGIELDGERLPALRRILPELALARPGTEYSEVEALEALVQVLSEQAPVVLLLDDVHCADRATIAALDYLQHRLAGVPGGIVTTVRTVHAPPDHPVRRLRPTTEMRLCPLTIEDLAPLGMPGLYEATGGNPRFVTDASTNGKPLELSSSLTDTLLAQLRAEGSDVYRMLLTASVLEQPFEPEPLAELLGVGEALITEELERLCELRILRVDGFRFGFRYDLVRQVLLGSISPARRRILDRQLDQLETQPMPSRPAA
jgi:hypothetical protein